MNDIHTYNTVSSLGSLLGKDCPCSRECFGESVEEMFTWDLRRLRLLLRIPFTPRMLFTRLPSSSSFRGTNSRLVSRKYVKGKRRDTCYWYIVSCIVVNDCDTCMSRKYQSDILSFFRFQLHIYFSWQEGCVTGTRHILSVSILKSVLFSQESLCLFRIPISSSPIFCVRCRATLYPIPDDAEERRKMIVQTSARIEDVNTVIVQTSEHRHRILVSSSRNITNWFSRVRKIKAIYSALNLFNFDVTRKCLIGESWCPEADMDKIRGALMRGTDRSGSTVPSILNRVVTKDPPPTFHRTNKFTAGFQVKKKQLMVLLFFVCLWFYLRVKKDEMVKEK